MIVERADLLLAQRLAGVADRVALGYYGRAVSTARKADGTVVTAADLATERALLDLLAAERPGDAVLSEERGARGSSPRRWLLDPIDGTACFLAGRRDWGTHVALEIDGRLAVAVLTRPTEQRRWWAAAGEGAYTSTSADPSSTRERLRVSSTRTLGEAFVSGFVEPGSAAAVALGAHATWTDDPISPIAALVEGRLDVVLDEGGAQWDQAPAALLVAEAGGSFCDPAGGSRIDLAWGLYCCPTLTQHAFAVLQPHLPGQTSAGQEEGPDADASR